MGTDGRAEQENFVPTLPDALANFSLLRDYVDTTRFVLTSDLWFQVFSRDDEKRGVPDALAGRMFTMPNAYPMEFRRDVVHVARNREPGKESFTCVRSKTCSPGGLLGIPSRTG